MIERFVGRRVRLQEQRGGEYVLAKMLNADGNQAVVMPEPPGALPLGGRLILESFDDAYFVSIPVDVVTSVGKATVLRHSGGGMQLPVGTSMMPVVTQISVTVRAGIRPIRGVALGGNSEAIAIQLEESLPPQSLVNISFESDGKSIELDGPVLICHARDGSFLVVVGLGAVSRLATIYWQKALKSA
jgi:hypothetical protein